jgi:hypothetical protein
MRLVSRTRSQLPALAAALLLVALAAAPTPARADGSPCPEATPSYAGPCGPSFQLPPWGDAGGWSEPSHYETLQLANVEGDKRDELIGRTAAGLDIYEFDTALGQWRPAVEADGLPQIITAFADPPPRTAANPGPPATDWTLPRYYDTIQAADIDGDSEGHDEVIARSAAGMIVFKYTGGTWKQLSTGGPLADAGGWGSQPSYYYPIQAADLNGDGKAELIARGLNGVTVLDWQNGNFQTVTPHGGTHLFADSEGQAEAKYYTDLQTGKVQGGQKALLVGRADVGVSAWSFENGGFKLASSAQYRPFADDLEQGDCPFPGTGAPGPDPSVCFGSGPAYYSTMQLADIDGDGRAELLGRDSQGLEVWSLAPDGSWKQLPALTDLSDAGGWLQESRYATIQTADVNGDGRAEVLALGPGGLETWSYDPAKKAWAKLVSGTPLQLTGAPWEERSHFATIQTGDIDGDGRADLIARGPYGVRTWFYDRRGNGGWEPYLPYGYQPFATPGQQAAFAALNDLARREGAIPASATSVRDIWASGNAPSQTDLTALREHLVRIGACTGPNGQEPPAYAACVPPAASQGFAAADWTAVLNELFAEIFWAEQVDGFFADLESVRQTMFLEQGAQLPAIGGALGLAAAENAEAQFDPREMFSTMLSLAGSLAGEVEQAAIPLEMASEIVSMLPSAAPVLTEDFKGTYATLQTKFAESVDEIDKALASQSQYVRQDPQVLHLVGELRHLGTWAEKGTHELDKAGLLSAAREGFATAVYRTLLPAVNVRWVIDKCVFVPKWSEATSCEAPKAGTPGVLGSAPSFTMVGAPASHNSPCQFVIGTYPVRGQYVCKYEAVVGPLNEKIWGQVSPSCSYVPGNTNTEWTFGCNLGLDPRDALAPDPTLPPSRTWNLAPVGPPVSAGAGSARIAEDGRATLRLDGTVALSRRLPLGRTRVTGLDFLAERGGRGELVRLRDGGRLRRDPMKPSGRGKGSVVYLDPPGGPAVSARLHYRNRHALSYSLRLRNVRLALPRACRGIRPGVDFSSAPVPLATTLKLAGGGRTVAIPLTAHWRCHRNHYGAVRRLSLTRPSPPRPGRRALALSLKAPHRVPAGGRFTLRARVRNQGAGTAFYPRLAVGLPRGLRSRAGTVRRLPALRAGRTRSLAIPLRAAGAASGRVCATVVATALDTHARAARACVRIRRPGAARKGAR